MEPLQKKYLLASSGLHLLLLTLLLFGSGFLPDRKEEDPLIPFRMMPTSVLESLMNDPADVARQIVDGIESGAAEVLADDFTREARASVFR